jgi:predicted solute-binding protein
MGDVGRRALEKLYSMARAAGAIDDVPRLDVI